MARELSPIDITTIQDFTRLIDEVHTTGKRRRVQRDQRDVAVLMPAPAPRQPTRATSHQAQIDAALATAGAWKDQLDPEQLKRDLNEAQRDTRPPRPV